VAAHGFAVNLVVVIVLAAAGLGLLSARPRLVRPAMLAAVALCAVDWVLVQDTGVFGGLGTDPNSMIPVALLIIAACLAWTANRTAPVPAVPPSPPVRPPPTHRFRPARPPHRHDLPDYGSVPAGAPQQTGPGRGAGQARRRGGQAGGAARGGRPFGGAAGALGITLPGRSRWPRRPAGRLPLIARALNGL
jgi:hypothetical protein